MRKNLFFGLSLIIVLAISVGAQGNVGSEDELKAKANELFIAENYKEAKLIYAQLLSLYPKDPTYNYRFGACVLQTEADKTKPMKYLSFAASKANVDPLAYFYLGRAYHLNYEFAQAVKQYSKFKNKASNEEKTKYSVDRQIEMCKNGKDLLTKMNEVQVLERQGIAEKDFYRIYDENAIGGKILAVPEQFKSKYDKKINDKSVVFLAKDAKQVYYSSYGKKGENGKDIYKAIKLGNGEWSEGVSLGSSINTAYDEDYAYIKPDGRTLYFASKGHSSMGGFDIFRSVLDDVTGLWSEPENLDFAFNSADDDFMFVTDQEEIAAYFTSNRVNEFGEVTVYKVLIERAPAELSVISGTFIAESNSGQKRAKITVIDKATQETVGVYETDDKGNYAIEIAKNGGEYQFNVETNEVDPIHTGVVVVPKQDEFAVLGQELRLVGTGNEQQLVIKNIFDGSVANNRSLTTGPSVSSSLIKMKANLEVNYSSNNLAALKERRKGTTSTINEGSQTNASNKGSASRGESGTESGKNNTKELANNTQSEKGSSAMSTNPTVTAVGIEKELNSLKTEKNTLIDSKQKAIDLQYATAIQLEQEASALFDQADAIETKGSQTEEVELKRKEAGEKALKASFVAQLAQELEASINDDLSNLDAIETSEVGISQAIGKNDLQTAGRMLSDLKSNSTNSKNLEEVVSASLNDIAERNSLVQKKITDFSSKAKSFSEEQSALQSQLETLKKKEESSSGKEKEELAKNIENTELDLKDLEYQSGILNKNLLEAKLNKKSLAMEKAELLAASNSLSSTSEESVQVSEEEKNELFNQLKKYRDNDKLAYAPGNELYASIEDNSISNEEGSNELASNNEATTGVSSSNQQQSSKPSNERGLDGAEALTKKSYKDQTIGSINLKYVEELNKAEAVADDEVKLTNKIQLYDNWLTDLKGKKSEVNQSYEAEIDENERSILKKELDQLSASINEQQKSKNDVESELAARQSGQFVADNSPITNSNEVTAASVIKADFTNLEFDQKAQATSEQSRIQLIAAKKALYEAGELAKQQEIAQESAYTLPTAAERTQAFSEANRLKKESEAKQIEAANKFAAFNLKEYQFNKAKIYEASDIDERYSTEGRDIAELLTDEADNFFTDAAILRSEVNKTDRLSQKEVNLQKAYDYELLALKKQQEALIKLGSVVNEALAADANAEENEAAKPFVQVIDDEEILAIVEAPKAKAAAEERSAQVVTLDATIITQESVADGMQEGNARDSVLALVEDLGEERAQLIREAALYYERERQIKEGFVGVQSSDKPASAQVLAPSKPAFEVFLDTVNVDADRQELIYSSPAFIMFADNRQALTNQVKAADEAYQEALELANENKRLQKQALVELSMAKAVKDEDERQQLTKSAQVIESTIKANEEKIETINLQIKVKNFLFQSLLEKDKSYLSKLRERERQEYIFLSNDYMLKGKSGIVLTDLPESLLTLGETTGSLESNETAQQTEELNSLNPNNSNLTLPEKEEDNDVDDKVIAKTPTTNDNKVESGSTEIGQATAIKNTAPNVKQATASKVNSPAVVSNVQSAVKIENIDLVPRVVKQAIFVTLNRNESAYNENKPIPTKTSLPEGIVYKVQVGAFRKEIPANTFKGFAPLMAEPTGTGITRYTAGLFVNFNNAISARDEIRKIGYPDAFVVAFLNGERISTSKARAESGSSSTSQTVTNFPKISSSTSSNPTNGSRTVASAEQVSQVPGGSKEALPIEFTSDQIEEVVNAKTVEGLYYTIQVGVFSAPVKKGVFNYEGLNVVALESGLYRYNAGIFNSVLEAADLKNTITATIKDAFVTAYYNGKRISLTEASKLKNQ
ncbi:MAG: hypothetical protein ACJAV5_000921 [Vicingaceae bacterium]|jgi:hypothetical protein